MNRPFFQYYRIPLILSISLAIVIITSKSSLIIQGEFTDYISIFGIILGSILGIFILDLDYFLHAYLLEPKEEFSLRFRDYIKDKDFIGVFDYIILHSEDIQNKTLNSLVFQVSLGIFSLVVSGNISLPYLVKALVISTLLNTIFRFYYFYFQGFGKDWFWILKKVPNKYFIGLINFIILVIVGFSISLFK